MFIDEKGRKFRNLPEQVAKNKKDIEEFQGKIDDLERSKQDKVEVNPIGEEGTLALQRIKIDGIVYFIQGGGGESDALYDAKYFQGGRFEFYKYNAAKPIELDISKDYYQRFEIDDLLSRKQNLLEVNPKDDPTGTLNKIKINDVVYLIPSGGSGGDAIYDVRYFQGGQLDFYKYNAETPTTIDLSKDFYTRSEIDNLLVGYQTLLTEDSEIAVRRINLGKYFLTETVLEQIQDQIKALETGKQDLLYVNPDEPASEVLNKIEIDGVVYSIPGGGSSDYNDLTNKPTINGVELRAGSAASELGLLGTEFAARTNEHLDSHDRAISEAEVRIGNLENGKQDKFTVPTDQPEVVLDYDGTKKELSAHLNQDVTNKLNRALLTPLAITEDKLVAVDSSGNQMMLAIGDGLSIQDNKLVAKEEQEILWTNPSPTSEFVEQDINIIGKNLENYKVLLIIWFVSIMSTDKLQTILYLNNGTVGKVKFYMKNYIVDDINQFLIRPGIYFSNANDIVIRIKGCINHQKLAADNEIIPYQIIGIK